MSKIFLSFVLLFCAFYAMRWLYEENFNSKVNPETRKKLCKEMLIVLGILLGTMLAVTLIIFTF